MKVIQNLKYKSTKKDNKSFQREVWDEVWSKNSFSELVNQLDRNPIYWKLLGLIKKDDSIIEAGCGFGQWVWKLHNQGYKITGVDNAKKIISRLKREQPNLKLKLADVEKLPFKNGAFDIYLSFGVIEHFINGPEKVLKEANRVLNKNGTLFLTVPYLNLFRFIRYKFIDENEGTFYQYLYSKDEIINIIENAGFKIYKISYFDFLSAVKRDFPLLWKIYKKFLKNNITASNNEQIYKRHSKNKIKKVFLKRLLYKLDSYILLIEARKKLI